MRIERYREDGEAVRRFFLVAEIKFADREASPRDEYDHNYYDDRELKEVVTSWMESAVSDRDDSPSVRFYEVPRVLDVDVESIARGDYPRSGY
ncbi:hypothetical protein ACFUJU_07830 [Streptomyces sp. NPDC057235]|uniref:hypothetical protein n=1 Tax=Streptomyces sp. NPDC057235 TaxID=3346058 RepID=UPI0036279260